MAAQSTLRSSPPPHGRSTLLFDDEVPSSETPTEPELPTTDLRVLQKKRKRNDIDPIVFQKIIQHKLDHPTLSIPACCRFFDCPEAKQMVQKRFKGGQFQEMGLRSENHRPTLLTDDEIRALKKYILDSYKGGLAANQDMIWLAIEGILEEKKKEPPHRNYLPRLMKHELMNGVKKRKTKVLASDRKCAQNPKVVGEWFEKWDNYFRLGGWASKPERIWNFDESGFRIGIMRGELVYVPEEAPAFYQNCPENRKQVTIIECINAAGSALPPYIIVEGEYHLEKYFNSQQTGQEVIEMSKTGWTNKEIGLHWLDHFILNAGLVEGGEETILFMDNHSSHDTEEFRAKCNKYNITPWTFPSHMTHIMQPLDVSVFQPYKHWHHKAVQRASRVGLIAYTIADFLWDLPSIRAKTFKMRTIQNGFKKAGLYPPNEKAAVAKMKIYETPTIPHTSFGLGVVEEFPATQDGPAPALVEESPQLPKFPPRPESYDQAIHSMTYWDKRMDSLLSSPSRAAKKEAFSGVQVALATGKITSTEFLKTTQEIRSFQNRANELGSKGNRRLQKGGKMLTHTANMKITVKTQQREDERRRLWRYHSKTFARRPEICDDKIRKARNRLAKAVTEQEKEKIEQEIIEQEDKKLRCALEKLNWEADKGKTEDEKAPENQAGAWLRTGTGAYAFRVDSDDEEEEDAEGEEEEPQAATAFPSRNPDDYDNNLWDASLPNNNLWQPHSTPTPLRAPAPALPALPGSSAMAPPPVPSIFRGSYGPGTASSQWGQESYSAPNDSSWDPDADCHYFPTSVLEATQGTFDSPEYIEN